MSTMLGKRKRRAVEPVEEKKRGINEREDSQSGSSEKEESPELDAQEIFRRHFETQFAPLPEVPKPTIVEEEEEEEEEEEDEWGGISEEETDGVQIVQHTNAESRMAAMSKEQLKAFMTSKPPSSAVAKTPLIRDKGGIAIKDDDDSEAANLKKDLALQRLLSESHLLESSSNPILAGNNRHKATDLRLQALGSKKSILQQEKMPMSHRKGIIAKKADKEETRRREARENGIILERAKIVEKKGADKRKDKGVGGPGVGRFSGGTLTLSNKDIFDIEGPQRKNVRRGGGGGSRGAGRGSSIGSSRGGGGGGRGSSRGRGRGRGRG